MGLEQQKAGFPLRWQAKVNNKGMQSLVIHQPHLQHSHNTQTVTTHLHRRDPIRGIDWQQTHVVELIQAKGHLRSSLMSFELSNGHTLCHEMEQQQKRNKRERTTLKVMAHPAQFRDLARMSIAAPTPEIDEN